MIEINNLQDMNDYVISKFPMEACGIVIENMFIPIENVASSPFTCFTMPSQTYTEFEDRMEAIVHSHTYQAIVGEDPRTPSKTDMVLARNTGLAQGIIHTDGTIASDVLWWNMAEPAPLLGRPYISGVYDCMTIVRDYYIMNFNHVIDIMPRSSDWLDDEPRYLADNLDSQGLVRKRISETREHDILVFAYGTRFASHLGVYIGDGKFIHHLKSIPSCYDSLDKYPRQHLATYRLEE